MVSANSPRDRGRKIRPGGSRWKKEGLDRWGIDHNRRRNSGYSLLYFRYRPQFFQRVDEMESDDDSSCGKGINKFDRIPRCVARQNGPFAAPTPIIVTLLLMIALCKECYYVFISSGLSSLLSGQLSSRIIPSVKAIQMTKKNAPERWKGIVNTIDM